MTSNFYKIQEKFCWKKSDSKGLERRLLKMASDSQDCCWQMMQQLLQRKKFITINKNLLQLCHENNTRLVLLLFRWSAINICYWHVFLFISSNITIIIDVLKKNQSISSNKQQCHRGILLPITKHNKHSLNTNLHRQIYLS